MKKVSIKKSLSLFTLLAMLFTTLVSCEQEKVEPELNVAPGGGTLTTFKAYTLDAADEQDIYGRIVFWKDNAKNTLVQISLYNTDDATFYPSGIYEGELSEASETEIMSLYEISGATGEFSTSKFYVIKDASFFDELEALDAYVQVMLADVAIAQGNVGLNATPVEEGD